MDSLASSFATWATQAQPSSSKAAAPEDSVVAASLPISAGGMHPLDSQVGGHAGTVYTTEDGSLIIKASLPGELAFYTALRENESLSRLREYTPEFIGVLKEEGAVAGSIAEAQGVSTGKESLVLKNVTYGFRRPNILDIKLGTVLHDESATEAKRLKMIRVARETTSGETGLRLTGSQVWNAKRQEYERVQKAYGKTIKTSQLPDGIARFFPLDALGDLNLLVGIIERIAEEVRCIIHILRDIELKMIGSSLLVVWEGDEEALRQCVAPPDGEDRHGLSVAAQGRQGDSEPPDDDSDDESDESNSSPTLAFSVKLIDFPHTRLNPGRGPDQGALLGLKTTLELLERRKAEVEAAQDLRDRRE